MTPKRMLEISEELEEGAASWSKAIEKTKFKREHGAIALSLYDIHKLMNELYKRAVNVAMISVVLDDDGLYGENEEEHD